MGTTVPGPPGLIGTTAVDGSLACDGYILGLEGVDTGILDPKDTYADPSQWEEKAKDLAGRFIKNFSKYENNESGKALVSAGPQL